MPIPPAQNLEPGADRAPHGPMAAATGAALAPAEEQLDPFMQVGPLRLRASDYTAYLDAADVWSSRLLKDMSDWAGDLSIPAPPAGLARVQSLAQGSARLGFTALAELAQALADCLGYALSHPLGMPQHAMVFLHAARELRRLVDRIAGGMVDTPAPYLLQALLEIQQRARDGDDGGGLRQAFLVSLPQRVAQLGDAWAHYRTRPESGRADLRVSSEIESLAGMVAQFGVAGMLGLTDQLRTLLADLPVRAPSTGPVPRIDGLLDELREEAGRMAATVTVAPPAALVVAGNESTRQLLAMVLAQEGYDVHQPAGTDELRSLARSGLSARAVAVIDMDRPEALAFLLDLRREPACSALPVLVTCASASEAFLARVYAAGADDVLASPFDPADVAGRLRRIRQLRAAAAQA